MFYAANEAQDASSGGLYQSLHGGNTWNLLSAAADWGYTSTAVDPLVLSTIHFGTCSWGMLRSVGSGSTWRPANNALRPIPTVRSIAIDAGLSSTVYVGTDRNGLFKNVNGGNTWNFISNGLLTDNSVDAMTIGLDIYRSFGDGVFVSTASAHIE
jgi:hypothetical protein